MAPQYYLALASLAMLTAPSAWAAPLSGLQAEIDRAAASGGHKTLELHAPPGQPEWVIDAPLRLPPGLTLQAIPPGLVIRATDDPGQTDRQRPVFVIAGTAATPISDVALRGFHLAGHFARAPIAIENATSVVVADDVISGSRGNAIMVKFARDVTIARVSVQFERPPQTDPAAAGADPHEGGAGIWCFACNDTRVEDNILDASAFWQPGPAWDSGNAAVCVPGKYHPGCTLGRFGNHLARALDMVAFYGGAHDVIAHNQISNGNTAAIYVNLCATPTAVFPARALDLRVTGNQIRNFREHGIDIVGAERPVFADNQITEVGGAGIALAQTAGASITGNTIRHAGLAWHPPGSAAQTAAIKLLALTHNTTIVHNTLDPGTAAFTLFWQDGTAANNLGGANAAAANNIQPGTLGIVNHTAASSANEVWLNGRKTSF